MPKVQQATVRTVTRWTYDLLSAAEHQADSGNLSLASRACEWLLTDDSVAGALGARVDALLGLVPTFEASGDKRRSNRAVKDLEAGEDWWTAYPESELNQLHTWGILLGVSLTRQSWDPNEDHGGRWLPELEFWHPETLAFDWQSRTWSVGTAQGTRVVVDPASREWILHTPYGKERPWARGLWRSLKNWVLLKQLAKQDLGIAGEKGRTAVVESPEDSTFEQRRALAAEIMASGSDAAIVLAAGFKMSMLEAGQGLTELLTAQIELAKKAIAIRIRGGNLSTEVKGDGGTQAAAKVQRATGDQPKLRWDAQTLSTTIHAQSLVYWAEFNFGDKSLAPWPKWPVEPEEDRSERATTIKTLGEGLKILSDLGAEFDPKKLEEEFGLSFVKRWGEPKAPAAPVPFKPNAATSVSRELPPAALENPRIREALEQGRRFNRRTVASGFLASKASGFLNGQLFSDALTEHATAQAEKLLQPTLDAVLEELDAATDYDDLRERLRARYEQLSPDELSELTYRVMVMAELAGRVAVNEDADA